MKRALPWPARRCSNTRSVPHTVIAWGELLWDLFPDGPRLGGAAANVAYHAAMLGDRSLLVSRVGHDELGKKAIAALRASGVDVSHVQIDDEKPTGTVRVEIDDGEPRYTIATEAAWDRIVTTLELAASIRISDTIVYGTLAQRTPLGSAALHQALAWARPDAVRLCDLNVRQPFATPAVIERALASATVVKLNRSEAAVLSELFGADDPIEWLLLRGVRLVALTLGSEGALLAQRGERVEQPGYLASGGDAVGAGDAFSAVLAHELHRGSSLRRIAERATRYASFVASERGGMPPIPERLRAELGGDAGVE